MALQLKIKNHPIEFIDNYFNGEVRINDLRRPGSKDGLDSLVPEGNLRTLIAA